MKRNKKIEKAGPHIINNKWLGQLNEKTVGIVVESVITRDLQKQIKPMRTENINLLKGENTIAVFHIRSCRFASLVGEQSQNKQTW